MALYIYIRLGMYGIVYIYKTRYVWHYIYIKTRYVWHCIYIYKTRYVWHCIYI